jgi:hypothetical protein
MSICEGKNFCPNDCDACIWWDPRKGLVITDKDAKEQEILWGKFQPAKCRLCGDYHSLNTSFFEDCPACDYKSESDVEDMFYICLHFWG